ncbi:MAG: hypothetical protein IKK59_03910 [Lachnospiraceae bacterium]|nr:hypothetical protein [Lachnospiraceae bacterium]
MKSNTHYSPTENGFAISGSSEVFNRPLYGGHASDDTPERFFTFAGDVPQFMGTVCDWTKGQVTYQEKCGVLNSGLAITPGGRFPFYYSEDIDQTSRWFHNSEDILAEFKNGWMEYELTQISSWFPDVRVKMEAYPLMPEDGYLVHYTISTDQRVYFVAGFGGLTDVQGRFEYKGEPRRYFSASDVKGNVIELGENRACITHTDGKTMHVATSFAAEFACGSAKAMAEPYVSTFLASEAEHEDDRVVRISAVIEPGQTLDGYIIAIHNSDEETLNKWLARKNPMEYIKQQIYAKTACIDVATPEKTLDLTIAPTVIAMDSSWHKDSFHHGAFAYHAPFLGWRNWYAPTVLGWGDRVAKTMEMYFGFITRGDVSKERIWYDDTPIPAGQKKFDRRFHNMENPVGRLPSHFNTDLTPSYGPYNMQECALDMMLYYIEWTGNLEIAEKYYEELCSMVEWERRVFDPDDDGLYQNVLNTWISDGHNYNGAGCAQSTAYNYRANLVLSKIARRIGRDGEAFAKRAEKIKKALNEKLWLANEGVIAESLDTIGNCLIHPSVELATVYHVMDSDMIDDFRAYRTLKYSEKHLKNIVTLGSDGRLCYSSAWLPKQYSQCGIFPSENAHLALVYFKLGLKEEGKKILDGIADCYFTGRNPGMAPHIQSARGTSDFGDLDFSDVSSTYLRLVTEGLFGIRINHLDACIYIAPGFPKEWEHASLTLKDIALHYTRRGNQEIFNIHCDRKEKKLMRIPMRSTEVETVLLDGAPIDYKITAAPNHSFLMIEVDKVGRFQLRIMHGCSPVPTITAPDMVLAGSRLSFEVKGAKLAGVFDVSEVLEDITIVGNKVYAKAKDVAGDHTLFLRAVSGEYDAWLAADYEILNEEAIEELLEDRPFVPVDITKFFNCNMTEVHEQAYIYPRPEGYSMGLFQNGRYSHNWNQRGRRVVYVDDTLFRTSGGIVHSPSGIPFATPAEKENLACVSMYDVFPTDITIPLSGKGQEIAVLFIASTYCMQAHVENACITVTYADGTQTYKKLVYPIHMDDWLTSALTTEGEIFYFNDFNHATVQKIRIDSGKELASIKIEAVANEIILGVAGVSISR